MKENIKLLAEQAGLGQGRWNTTAQFDSFLEKFSELIVRQCINKIENEAEQYAEPTWAFEIVNDLKETFRVEE